MAHLLVHFCWAKCNLPVIVKTKLKCTLFGGQNLFVRSGFNQDISEWDVNRVTNMWVSAGTTGQIGLVFFAWSFLWCANGTCLGALLLGKAQSASDCQN